MDGSLELSDEDVALLEQMLASDSEFPIFLHEPHINTSQNVPLSPNLPGTIGADGAVSNAPNPTYAAETQDLPSSNFVFPKIPSLELPQSLDDEPAYCSEMKEWTQNVVTTYAECIEEIQREVNVFFASHNICSEKESGSCHKPCDSAKCAGKTYTLEIAAQLKAPACLSTARLLAITCNDCREEKSCNQKSLLSFMQEHISSSQFTTTNTPEALNHELLDIEKRTYDLHTAFSDVCAEILVKIGFTRDNCLNNECSATRSPWSFSIARRKGSSARHIVISGHYCNIHRTTEKRQPQRQYLLKLCTDPAFLRDVRARRRPG